jgi:aquaporin Z
MHDSIVENDIPYELEYGFQSHVMDHATVTHGSSLSTRMFSEFVGTFFLVSTMCLNTALKTGYVAWSGGAVLVSMIYALSGACEGHFNPAVTLAIMLSGRNKCSGKAAWGYIVAQLVSAIPAGVVSSCIAADGLFTATSKYSWLPIGFAEAIFTLILAYIVLVVATSEKHASSQSVSWPNYYYALAIGFVFVGASYAASNISGGYLNPAVALGFAVDGQPSISSSASVKGWPHFFDWIIQFFAVIVKGIAYYAKVFYYWVPEFLGAALAAVFFYLTHRNEFSKHF